MAGRGRPAGFKMTEAHRTKISKSQILKRLIEFSEGKENIDMAPHQVTAALGLLKKVMPDMTTNELTGDADNPLEINVTIGGNAKS